MEQAVRIAVLAVLCALCCMVIRSRTQELSVVTALAGCVLIFLISLRFLEPILGVFDRLREMTGMVNSVTSPMLKVAGIGILIQIAGAVCEDAGERALQQAVEIGGGFLAAYASLPLLSAVIDLLEDTLG